MEGSGGEVGLAACKVQCGTIVFLCWEDTVLDCVHTANTT